MTGALADSAASLGQVLASLGTVLYAPERVTPPAVLIEARDPWLTTDDASFGWGAVHYSVTVITRPGTNAASIAALQDTTQQALAVLLDASHDWTPDKVSAPFTLAVGDAAYLAARIDVDTLTALT